MKKTFLLVSTLGILSISLTGCGSSPTAASPEEKKAFAGGPPPADYMKNVNAGDQAARDAAAKAKAAHQ
jgi:hypothetical protein